MILQAVRDACRARHRSFSAAEIYEAVVAACPDATFDDVWTRLRRLEFKGCIERVGAGPARLTSAEFVNAGLVVRENCGKYERAADSGWDRLWRGARVLKAFSIPRLQAVSGESYENVRTFLRRYRRAGYIALAGRDGRTCVYRIRPDAPPARPPHKFGRKGAANG